MATYYDDLVSFLERAIEERFVREEFRPLMLVEQEPSRLLDRLREFKAPRVRKWLGPEET